MIKLWRRTDAARLRDARSIIRALRSLLDSLDKMLAEAEA